MEEIKLQNIKSLIPPVYFELLKVKEGELSYLHYQVRHPGAIFSIHFSDLLSKFNLLYKNVNNAQANPNPMNDEERSVVISSTLDFLLSLNRYFESFYEIFLCFCPEDNKPITDQALFKWFNNKPYKNIISGYFNVLDTYLEKYRKLLNALKHSSNQLSIFQFINQDDRGSTIGFYLEGVNDKGVIGPVLDFHPMFDDRYTAWSYNLHLKNFYYLAYKISSEAELVVNKLCQFNNIVLSEKPASLIAHNLEGLSLHAFNGMRRLRHSVFFHFPQEFNEKTKVVSISDDNNTLVFSDYVAGENIVPRGSRALITPKGDGFSRSWSLLYTK